MRRSWVRTRRVPILAIPVLASLAFGSAATASPPVHAPASAKVTWHPLALINHWASARTFGTGNPSWAVHDGVVYLSGSIRNIRAHHVSEFAVLPLAARPAHAMYITVYTESQTLGSLYINPSGKMRAYGPDAAGFTSLAGVSFPARSAGHHSLMLLNGWKSSQARWNTGNPAYHVSGGVVYLSGSLHGGTSGTFATLPSAAWPASNMYITVYTWDGTTGVLHVGTDGTLEAFGGNSGSFTSLAGVSYPVASATLHPLTTLNDWSGCCGNGNPAYLVSHGVVYLSGSLTQPAAGSTIFATLPAKARPAHQLYIKVYTNDVTIGTVLIEPNGTMEAYSSVAADAQGFTSLASISYPLGS